MLDGLPLGRFQPGDSLLHRVDALCKLVLLPLLVMAGFSSDTWLALGALVAIALGLQQASSIPLPDIMKGLRPLRWLLLATLLLHLFFSPGRTLFGVSWLSYDGLLFGVAAITKLALALFFASLLSLTTSPQELTGALSRLLRPFERFGLPSRRVIDLLGLVMAMAPVLRQESQQLIEDRVGKGGRLRDESWFGRGRTIGRLLEPLVVRLADRADEMARRLAAGEKLFIPVEIRPLSPVLLLVTWSIVLLLVVWIAR